MEGCNIRFERGVGALLRSLDTPLRELVRQRLRQLAEVAPVFGPAMVARHFRLGLRGDSGRVQWLRCLLDVEGNCLRVVVSTEGGAPPTLRHPNRLRSPALSREELFEAGCEG